MKSILVTGGSGYLGRYLAKRLLADGWERICIYSRSESRQHEMRSEIKDARLRYFIGDVRDVRRLERAMLGCDVVVHAAALKRIEVGEYDPGEMARTNVDGSRNVLEAAIYAEVKRAVLISSDKAVAPRNCYGATKLVAERLFAAAPALSGHRMTSCIVRYGNVAGSTGSLIPIWRRPGPHKMTDPECTRYWLFVKDAVSLVTQAINGNDKLLIPNLPAFRIADLAEAMNVNPEIIGLPAGEKLAETMDGMTDSSEARRMTVKELKEALNGVA